MHDNLTQALLAFQRDIRTIKPETKGQVRGKSDYKYADLAQTIKHIRKPLADNGLAISQPLGIHDGQTVVKTVVRHVSGQEIVSMMPVQIGADMQAAGSAITYARRYQLWSILGLAVSGIDDDGAGATGKPAKTRPPINDTLLLEKYRAEIYACKTRAARKQWWDKNKGDVLEASQEVNDAVNGYMAEAAQKEVLV